MHLDKPVFNSVAEAVKEVGADTSIIFVPPAFASDAIMEAAEAGIKVIITITEGIPVNDMTKAYAYVKSQGATLPMGEIDIGSTIFECGQTYVALSRIQSLEGLYLCAFNPNKIRINKKVQDFYNKIPQCIYEE